MSVALYQGNNIAVLKTLADNSVDSVVTDPPYGLSFMGKKWDHDVPTVDFWKEVFRVLKPGGHVISFSGTRTYHRMVINIEDAGFEIHDQIGWLFGQGFPKSMDISKAIDKTLGAERSVVGSKLGLPGYSLRENDTDEHERKAYGKFTNSASECAITAPATPEAKQWEGWGTALKPAWEPCVVARKPSEGDYTNIIPEGIASKFFYCAKASKKDRAGSKHPTVKPVALMSYLCKLVTPPGGVILDPFAGSGTTGEAAVENGFKCILIELEDEYANDIRNRLVMFIEEDKVV